MPFPVPSKWIPALSCHVALFLVGTGACLHCWQLQDCASQCRTSLAMSSVVSVSKQSSCGWGWMISHDLDQRMQPPKGTEGQWR